MRFLPLLLNPISQLLAGGIMSVKWIATGVRVSGLITTITKLNRD